MSQGSPNTIAHQVFDGERLSHAYIAGGGMADAIAMAAVCSGKGARPCMGCAHCGKASRGVHTDITVIDKLEGKREILVEQIRELKRDVIVVPGEAAKKAYIINSAETMNKAAQNAFLQMLEEPPSHAVFILRTENPAALLRTVRSRCVELKARPDAGSGEAGAEGVAAGFFSALEGGNVELARFMFRLEKMDREEFAAFLGAARGQAAEMLRAAPAKTSIPRDVLARSERVLFRAGEYLDLNVGSGHIAGMLIANIVK